MVPTDMKKTEGVDIIYPLNQLEDIDPDIYAKEKEKYATRKKVMDQFVHTLECKWNDVVHLSPIHPSEIKKALEAAKLPYTERKFYQIDPELLDPAKTTIYLYHEGPSEPEHYMPFDHKRLVQYTNVPDETKKHYGISKKIGEEDPALFVGVPHILHKGPIDMSQATVITV